MVDVVTGEHGPASNELIKFMQNLFGQAFTVSRGYSSAHDGIDLPAKLGTPVYAVAGGIVSYARDARKQDDKGSSGWAKYGGKVVNVDVGSGLRTQFAHLNSISVKEGQFVKKGQQIGTVGNTGGTPDSPTAAFVGTHLHFGLWDTNQNKMINPQAFLEGDTTNSYLGADWTKITKAALTSLGISTQSDYVLTTDDAIKIVQGLFPDVKEQGAFAAVLTGQKVGPLLESAAGGGPGEIDLDVGGAIKAVGQQLSDTLTWVGFIIVGIVLIAGGIYLARPNTVIKESE